MIPMTEHIGTNWAWAIPALSAVAFFIVLPFRRYLPLQGAFVSILAILLGFALFWFVLGGLLNEGVVSYGIDWLRIGDTSIGWGVAVDEISVTMLGLVTFVALLVQVYSLGYMKHDGHYDPGLGRYYAFHSLFVAAMLALVLADNLLFLYIAWELVGLGSYLLIGFWYERRSAAEAAKKAFVTTRIGDVGLLIGIILLFRATGTFDISTIIHIAQNGGISDATLTASTLLIFMGAMGKSAQFPFHVWLPDAMEGPTPVSALIHAATMVAAGVYLVARLMPLFELGPCGSAGGGVGWPVHVHIRGDDCPCSYGHKARTGLLDRQSLGTDDARAGFRWGRGGPVPSGGARRIQGDAVPGSGQCHARDG